MHKKTVFGIAAATAAAPLLLAGPAMANTANPNVGPGDGIRSNVTLETGEEKQASCSINSVGHGADGTAYAMTAGHCHPGTMAPEVIGGGHYDDIVYDAEGNRIGEYVAYTPDVAVDGWEAGNRDYGLIKLDEGVETHTYAHSAATRPTPIPGSSGSETDAPAQEISGVVKFQGDDNVLYHAGVPMTKDGETSGRTNGFILMTTDDYIYSWTMAAPGDSGGIGHIDGANAGITSGGNSFIPFSTYERTDVAIADAEERYGIEYTQEGGNNYVEAPAGPVGQITEQALDAAEKFDEAIANGSSSSAAADYTPATDAVNQTVNDVTNTVQHSLDTVIEADQQAVSAVYGGTEQYVQDNYANEYNQLSNVVPENMVSEGFNHVDQALRTHLDVSADDVAAYQADTTDQQDANMAY